MKPPAPLLALCLLPALLWASACARHTNIPGHNLDGVPGGGSHTLLLTNMSPADRQAAVDRFVDVFRGSGGLFVVAHGQSAPEADVARLTETLLARGIPPSGIRRRTAGDGGTLALVCEDRSFRALDDYWFSAAAVSPNFGLSAKANMAAQMHRPEQSTQPETLDAPNPMGSIGPVERYQSGQGRELRGTSVSSGGGGRSR